MKWLKKAGLFFLVLPMLLVGIFVFYELFGMCVNHIATKQQTDKLQADLEHEIPDLKIVQVSSETGNTSGTGNHVDCLSAIVFSTEMQEAEIEKSMAEHYALNEWDCFVEKLDEGYYRFYLNTSAPFYNNIEGH